MDTSEPAVSVIIPCFGVDEFIALQMQALTQQRDAPAFEILLVDNGNNATLSHWAELGGIDVRVIDATRESGTAYARNMGIAHARGGSLLFCDADDVVGPTWVRDGAEQLRAWPAFSGGAVPFEPELFRGSLAQVWATLEQHIEPRTTPLPLFGEGAYPILLGCSFGMTRELALRVGGFDRSFGAQAEDNDLAFRLLSELGFVPAASDIAIAYRRRTPQEETFARAYEAGLKHALMCARHQSWDISPSYQGRWILRSIKLTLTELLRGELARDPLGRRLGVAVGRLRFECSSCLPPVRLGVTSTCDWGSFSLVAGQRLGTAAFAA